MNALFFLALLVAARPALAQTQLVSEDFFPADMEFRELRSIREEASAATLQEIRSHPEASLFAEAGFRKLASRTYELEPAGRMRLEIVTLRDGKGAYSLLTLLGDGSLEAGPPGDFHVASSGALVLQQANVLVRIEGDAPPELARRVALSVCNRIGAHERPPVLISRFPAAGREPRTVRYFLGPAALQRFGYPDAPAAAKLPPEVEIGQARYTAAGRSGTLTLLNFPTVQIADEYYGTLYDATRAGARTPLFFKRTGPLVGVLAGPFDPPAAERILDGLQFTYTVQWIYDRASQRGRTVWGMPVAILGTVVRSIVFTGLLCVVSLGLGILVALFRVLLRTYAPGNMLDDPERTGMIRLKMDGK